MTAVASLSFICLLIGSFWLSGVDSAPCLEWDPDQVFSTNGECWARECREQNQELCNPGQTTDCTNPGSCAYSTDYERMNVSMALIRQDCPQVWRAGCDYDDLVWDLNDCDCPRCNCTHDYSDYTYAADYAGAWKYNMYDTVDQMEPRKLCYECRCEAWGTVGNALLGFDCSHGGSKKEDANTVTEMENFECEYRVCSDDNNGGGAGGFPVGSDDCDLNRSDRKYCHFRMTVDENDDTYDTVCVDSSNQAEDGRWDCGDALYCEAWGATAADVKCVYAEIEAQVGEYDCVEDAWKSEYWNITRYYSCCDDADLCNYGSVAELTTNCTASPSMKDYYEHKIMCDNGAREYYTTNQSRYWDSCDMTAGEVQSISQCDVVYTRYYHNLRCECDLAQKLIAAAGAAHRTAISNTYYGANDDDITTYNEWNAYLGCGALFACPGVPRVVTAGAATVTGDGCTNAANMVFFLSANVLALLLAFFVFTQ